MPVISYGPQAKMRAKRLLEALLNYANGELENCDRLPIQINWRTDKRLVVRTKIRYLEELTAKDSYNGKLSKPQIKEALKRFEDLLQMLEDNRLATQGAEDWHFTLNLWHQKRDIKANLQQFEAEWERLRSLKVKSENAERDRETEIAETQGEAITSCLTDELQGRNANKKLESAQDEVPNYSLIPQFSQFQISWGEAPDVSTFYGRVEELTLLEQWILTDCCRLVMLVGMGGIGKTALAVKVARQLIQHSASNIQHFQFVVWRSLRNAPPIEDLLADLIQFLSHQQETKLPESVDGRISCLIKYLRASRCLLILDNAESVLRSDERAGTYRPGFEGYGQLFRCIGETHHYSCLILTSREKPRGLGIKEGQDYPVRSLRLAGLAPEESQQILREKGCFASEGDAQTLVTQYSGNPLALKIIATTIQELFDGNVAQFLIEGTTIFGDISDLLNQQFNRLSALEQQVMYWLAINREWVSLSELQEDMISPVGKGALLEVLESLQLRSLIEKSSARFTQQPVVMEYLIQKLIEQVCEELVKENDGLRTESAENFSLNSRLSIFNTYALIKAQTKDYLRNTQIRLILKPIVDYLLALFGNRENVQQQLNGVLATLRSQPGSMSASSSLRQPSYAAGNLLNLLGYLDVDLSGYDFSGLTVWQVYLQGINLHRANFVNADLTKSVFTQILGDFLCATFSPTGKLLATGVDNDVLLWQVDNSRQLARFRGHTAWVVAIAFSPDGTVLASGSHDQTVRLWDVQHGQCHKTLQGHSSWIRAIAFSPDGCLLASGSNDHTIRLWNTCSGECLRVLQGHGDRVIAVIFSPDGQTLISGSDDRTLKLWDVQTGDCLKTIETHVNWALSIALHPDGKTLTTGSDQNSVKFWDIHAGRFTGVLSGYDAQVWSLTFSPNGQLLATGAEDKTVKLWDVETKQCLKTLRGHCDRVWLVEFSSDGQTLVTAGSDQTIRLWDVQTGQPLRTLEAYNNWVSSVTFSPNGQILASSSKDQQLRLWDSNTGECLKKLQGHTNVITSVSFSPNGEMLASSSDDHTIKLWQVNTGQCILTMVGHQGWVQSVSFRSDGQLLASSSDDQMVKIWDIHTGECVQTLQGHTHRIKSVAYMPSTGCKSSSRKDILASGSDDQSVKIWDGGTGECLQTLVGHTDWVLSVAFSPDGDLLASGSGDRTIKLWQVNTGECLLTLTGHTQRVRSLAFSPDGCLLASGSEDHSVKLWDLRAGGRCIKTLHGHSRIVWSVAFDSSGNTLASGSEDETIIIWDIREIYPESTHAASTSTASDPKSTSRECLQVLRTDRPYEGMNITGVIGLTSTQKATLKSLGAVEIE